jgi:hypothetical protein
MHDHSYNPDPRSDSTLDYSGSGACGPIREKKYSGLEAAAAAQQKRKEEPMRDSLNSRYSSDPCKVIGEEMPMMPAPPTPLHKKLQQQEKNPIDQQIPVDEDDYLQPKSTKPLANYIDLVNETPATGEFTLVPSPIPILYPRFFLTSDYLQSDSMTPPAQKHMPSNYIEMKAPAIDNPEYFDSGQNNNQNSVNIHKTEKQPLRVRSMSSESEGKSSNQSEPDYYNEFDHLSKSRKNNSRLLIDPRTESTV